jgi:predicted transcriptional regulator YdeE
VEPEFVTRAEGSVLGIQERSDPTKADYKALWEGRFMPRHDEIKGLALDGSYYSVYYPTGEPGLADIVAGMMVPDTTRAPEGLVMRPVPGGLYASFRCTMQTIGSTWGSIYGEWLPASKYEEDETRPAIEHYPPEMSGNEPLVMLFVAVKPKK